jgi:WD40 repeat protein
LSRDGRLAAVGATDGTVHVRNARLLRKVQRFRAGPGVVADGSFSPDGRALLVAGNDLTKRPPTGYIGIWRIDGEMPRLLRKLEGGLPLYNWAAFSPDGAVVAAVGPSLDQLGGENGSNGAKGDGLVAEWEAETGKLLARPTHVPGGGMTNDVSFAARGTTVAVSQWGNMAAVVDPPRREILAHWKHSSSNYTVGVALSPDGKRVATSDFDGFVRVWDATSGKLVLPPIQASDSNSMTVDWSPDGSRLLVFGSDIRLYDAGTGRQIGASLPAEPTFFNYATFSPDGRTIAAADSGGNVWLYPATADGWQEAACRLANRNLSRTEWDTFVPGRPYRAVCPG